MVLFDFSGDVVEDIRSGRKVTTIRRQNDVREEQLRNTRTYNLWQRVRTPERIHIGDYQLSEMYPMTFPEWRALDDWERELVAHLDGFESGEEMEEWFVNHYGDELDSIHFTVHRWVPPAAESKIDLGDLLCAGIAAAGMLPFFENMSCLDGFMEEPDGNTMPGFVLHDVKSAIHDTWPLESRIESLTLDLKHLIGMKDSATYREWEREAAELKNTIDDLQDRLVALLPEEERAKGGWSR